MYKVWVRLMIMRACFTLDNDDCVRFANQNEYGMVMSISKNGGMS